MTVDMAELSIVSATIIGMFQYDAEDEETLTEKIRTYRKGWRGRP